MIKYDKNKNELTFSSGNVIYSYGNNPNIGLYESETQVYSYGYDSGFNIGESQYEIKLIDAIEIAEVMIETWIKHKEYLLGLQKNGNL